MFSQTVKLLPVARSIQYTAVERCRQGCTSSLFVPRDKASEACAVLIPYVNIDIKLDDPDSMKKNIQSRGLDIDVQKVRADWSRYKSVKSYLDKLEIERSETRTKYAAATAAKTAKALDKLKVEHLEIKEKIKIAHKELTEVEKNAFHGGLSLPNNINPETPALDEEKIVHNFGSKPDVCANPPNHIEVANKLGLIEYYDSSYYFLKGDAALFEMGTTYFFMDKLKDAGFIQMSNSDFARSCVVAGVGIDPTDANAVFTLEQDTKDPISRLHLVGGASLASFCAYHTKTVTDARSLPLRYMSTGRHYNPENKQGLHGLFSTWQSSAVETFVLTANKEMAAEEFKSCLEKITGFYEALGYHFRILYLPPDSLQPWESLRASFQMFSPSMGSYLEVGNLSVCDDYISQRLLMCCQGAEKGLKFTHVISGTVVSVPRILGCILEYDSDKFEIPANIAASAI